MKKEIITYLRGRRDYRQGVALYQKYGFNLRLKKQFAHDENATLRAILIEELRKLAGISEREMRTMQRKAGGSVTASSPQIKKPEPTQGNRPTTETQKKIIGFRQKFPFLNEPDCPDELKILVADMFTAYGKYKEAIEKLSDLREEETDEAARLCKTAVEEYLKNRDMWEELEYYKEHGTLLGKAVKIQKQEPAEDYSGLSDLELLKKHNSALANVSKRKKALEKAQNNGIEDEIIKADSALKIWIERKELLEKELENRKKK